MGQQPRDKEGHFMATKKVPPKKVTDLQVQLSEKLRKMLLKKEYTITELADALGRSPKEIRKVIESLNAGGYTVVSHEEGKEPRLLIDGNLSTKPRIVINAKEHFGKAFRFDFGTVSDTHLCSKYYRPEVLNAIYDNFAAHGIKHVFHGGNYVEGEARFNRFELLAHGMSGQMEYFAKEYPKRKGITTYIVSGDDHEGWWQQREGIDIGQYMESVARANGRTDLVNLGYMEADVAVCIPGGAKCKLRVMHAGGGSSYAISYTAQKLIESLEGGEKPQILLIGHYHKTEYLFYRNIHALQLGTTKAQDTFMRKKRLAAHIAGWRCSALIAKDGSIVELTTTLIPFFNQGYYESMAIDPKNNAVRRLKPNETYNVTK